MKRKSEESKKAEAAHLIAPGILVGVAILFFVTAGLLFSRYGTAAYFAHYGKPLHLGSASNATVKAESIPHFSVSGTVASDTVSAGDTQTITISAKTDQSTPAEIKVWIKRDGTNKEVWKSPDDVLLQFSAAKTVTKTYTYVIKDSLPSAKYNVGVILTSKDDFTDYYVNENVTEFNVQ